MANFETDTLRWNILLNSTIYLKNQQLQIILKKVVNVADRNTKVFTLKFDRAIKSGRVNDSWKRYSYYEPQS